MEALLGGIASFSLFHIISHPNSRINKKFPTMKLNRFQIAPHINFQSKNHVIHFHHWMIFSPLYVVAQTGDHGIISAGIIKGLLIGGIIQGVLYRDRFRIVFKHHEYSKIKQSHYHLQSLWEFLPLKKKK